MGQANLEFAMGNFDSSKELCLRVVQLQPHSTQPYSTLSSIYESTGDLRRATDYLLCAAVVKPRDAGEHFKPDSCLFIKPDSYLFKSYYPQKFGRSCRQNSRSSGS
jgi:hypothetical protein